VNGFSVRKKMPGQALTSTVDRLKARDSAPRFSTNLGGQFAGSPTL